MSAPAQTVPAAVEATARRRSASAPPAPAERPRATWWWAGPLGITLAALCLYILVALTIHAGPPAGGDAFATQPPPPPQPTRLDRLLHWDGGWYLDIIRTAYRGSPLAANFFPLFPAVTAGLQRALPFLSIYATGILVNVLATCAAMCLVDRTVADWPRRHRLGLVALLVSLPMAYFYAMFYAEALFVFAVALTLWALSRPGRLWWAAAGVSLATLDRAAGIVLLIPLGIALSTRERSRPTRGLAILAAACAGGAAVLVVDRVALGSAFAFVDAHGGWADHPISLGLRGTLHILEREMLLRPGYDSARAAGLWIAAIVPLLVVVAFFWRRDLAAYVAAAYVLSMVTGGYSSAGRYVLVLLPAWIGTVAVVRRHPAAWVAIGAAVVVGLLVNVALIDRFVAWRWGG